MPINEAGGYRRSNLTKEQRQAQEAAIFGLQSNDIMQQLTHEEIERMRAIVAQHDTQEKGGIKEFDLNNPPRLPYRFQEFPKLVYDHESGHALKVNSREHEQEALGAGYRLEPFIPEPAEVKLSAAEAAEAERLDRIARKRKQQ